MAQKFTVIIKSDFKSFIKYRNVTSIKKLVTYLDKNYPQWRWFNIFDKEKNQVGSYSRKNGYINAPPSIKKASR